MKIYPGILVYLYSNLWYKIYAICFINFEHLRENVSKLGNLQHINYKCATYIAKRLATMRTFNITVSTIILFEI